MQQEYDTMATLIDDEKSLLYEGKQKKQANHQYATDLGHHPQNIVLLFCNATRYWAILCTGL